MLRYAQINLHRPTPRPQGRIRCPIVISTGSKQ